MQKVKNAKKLETTAYNCKKGWTKVGDGPAAYCIKQIGVATEYCKEGWNPGTDDAGNKKCLKPSTAKEQKASACKEGTIRTIGAKNLCYLPVQYSCKKGYVSGKGCYKKKQVSIEKKEFYSCSHLTGYTLKGKKCYKNS